MAISNESGSALILVVLMTLILSATAIVALRDVARTTRGSAVFRTKAQAETTADSADRVFLDYAGDRAEDIDAAVRGTNVGTEDFSGVDEGGIFGANNDDAYDVDGDGVITLRDRQRSLAIRGGILKITPEELADNCPDCDPMITNLGGDETGLFAFDATVKSFESRRESDWRVWVRDPTDGFPAIGYGSNQCVFRTYLVTTESNVGQPDPDWTRSNNVASSRFAVTAALGPLCSN